MRCSAVGPVPAGGSRVQRSALQVPPLFLFFPAVSLLWVRAGGSCALRSALEVSAFVCLCVCVCSWYCVTGAALASVVLGARGFSPRMRLYSGIVAYSGLVLGARGFSPRMRPSYTLNRAFIEPQ